MTFPSDHPNVNAISQVSGTRVSNWISVSFRRTRVTGAKRDFDLGPSCQSYWILYAFGEGQWEEHESPGSNNGPYVSTSKISACYTGAIAATRDPWLTKANVAHAALMLIAWLCFSPVASLSARYLKKHTTKWFPAHQYLQVGVVLLTILGAIVIRSAGNRIAISFHGVVGWIVFSCVLVQLLLGACVHFRANSRITVSRRLPQPDQRIFAQVQAR